MGDDEDGGIAKLWLLLELLLELLKAKLEFSPPDAAGLVVEELDCRGVGLIRTVDNPKLFEPVSIWEPVLELLDKETLDEMDPLELDSVAELLYKFVLELREDATVAVVRVVLLLEEVIGRVAEVPELVDDKA
ncbi:MAG: hypothetical protein Q9221_006514 [Calogaya cf. arnoldii]